jgi:Co/Zn/Cd efflux system component
MKGVNKQTSIVVLISLTFVVFIAELVGGYYTGSIALVADSFHMYPPLTKAV